MRTSNLLDRAFREVRRRAKVVGRFPTEKSALTVIYGVLTIDSPRWRGMKIEPEEIKEVECAIVDLEVNPIELDFLEGVA